MRQTGGASRLDLLQRNLRLGQKPDCLGDAGRGAAGVVIEGAVMKAAPVTI